MRWLEDAVQKGRNHQANTHTLLHVASIIKNVEEQRREVEETEKKEDGESVLTTCVYMTTPYVYAWWREGRIYSLLCDGYRQGKR